VANYHGLNKGELDRLIEVLTSICPEEVAELLPEWVDKETYIRSHFVAHKSAQLYLKDDEHLICFFYICEGVVMPQISGEWEDLAKRLLPKLWFALADYKLPKERANEAALKRGHEIIDEIEAKR